MLKFILALALLFHVVNAEEKGSISDSDNDTNQSNDESNETDFNRRIIGGDPARPGQFPYVARLTMNFGSFTSLCSGTVLSNRVILTAAHCVYSYRRKPTRVQAQVGTVTYTFSQNEIFPNLAYNDWFSDDIAILKLASNKPPMTNFGLPPHLANHVVNARTPVVAVGWGKTSDAGPVSSTLQYVNVNTISIAQCQGYYGWWIVTPKTICTLDLGKGICGGDSGGPLLETRRGATYVIGVNAFGPSRCQSYNPSGYTYVPAFYNWLQNTIN